MMLVLAGSWNCPALMQFVLCIIQGTIEEKIYQRQTAKQGLSGTVADAKDTLKIEFSREELKVSMAPSFAGLNLFFLLESQSLNWFHFSTFWDQRCGLVCPHSYMGTGVGWDHELADSGCHMYLDMLKSDLIVS